MTVRATGTNAPLHKREQKALKRLKKLADKYISEGMNPEEAEEKAREEMRKNNRGDWRDG